MNKILKAYENGEWGLFMKNKPYSRQLLSQFKKDTGVDYTTFVFDGDLMVIFEERTAIKLINE